jgi:hypothetical protein
MMVSRFQIGPLESTDLLLQIAVAGDVSGINTDIAAEKAQRSIIVERQ